MNHPQESSMFKWRNRFAAFVLAGATPLFALAENAILAITSNPQAATDVVRIELAEPLGLPPNGFLVQTPPRVAIDLRAGLDELIASLRREIGLME